MAPHCSSHPLSTLPSGLCPIWPCFFLPNVYFSTWLIISLGLHTLFLAFQNQPPTERKMVPNLIWDRTFYLIWYTTSFCEDEHFDKILKHFQIQISFNRIKTYSRKTDQVRADVNPNRKLLVMSSFYRGIKQKPNDGWGMTEQ